MVFRRLCTWARIFAAARFYSPTPARWQVSSNHLVRFTRSTRGLSTEVYVWFIHGQTLVVRYMIQTSEGCCSLWGGWMDDPTRRVTRV